MASDAAPGGGEVEDATSRRRRRWFPLAILLAGGALLAYLSREAPHDQHLRVVLGAGAASVTGVSVAYATPAGDVVREARLAYDAGAAPRVVALEPRLPDGDYRVRIEVDTREGRREVERRVTLGGGTTSVEMP